MQKKKKNTCLDLAAYAGHLTLFSRNVHFEDGSFFV